MVEHVYAVEQRKNETWAVVGDRVFTTRTDAENFREKYLNNDMRAGQTIGTNVRVTEYRVVD